MSPHESDRLLIIHLGNAMTTAAVGSTLVGLLPPIAALFAIVWYALQIWESATVRKWLRGRAARSAPE